MPYTYRIFVHLYGNAEAWLAFAALAVAVISAGFAGVAVAWQRSEHTEFLKRMRVRADIRLQLSAVGNLAPGSSDPLAVMGEPGQAFEQVLEIGISNTGTGAAGPTVIDLLVPANVAGMTWCDGAGNPVDSDGKRVDSGAPPLLTEERLTRESGTTPALWISRELRRVSTKGGVICHIKLQVNRYERQMPIRVKAQCDELPEAVQEVVCDFELKVHDRTPPYGLREAVL